jgi:outer membrane receptor protein involved in Fe transport
MRMSSARFWLAGRLLGGAAAAALLAGGPAFAEAVSFKVPPQPAETGIAEFARQAHLQILAPADALRGKRTGAVIGALSLDDALDRLLSGSHLTIAFNDGRTISLAEPRPGLIKAALAVDQPVATAAAQPAPAPAAPPAAGPQQQAAVAELVVTGSHISTAGFTAPTPVTVVPAAQLQQKAAGSVSEALHDIPQFAANTGPANASSGAQSASKATLNLYNLGASRTLVLVDGQRHVADGTGNVFDTNLIPVSLIDRVDVVTGGASAAYGSDAVAGVVNFVMKDHLEGFTLDFHEGFSEYGDAVEFAPSAAFGKSFLDGKLHLVIGGDYTDNKGTRTFYSRPWGQLEPGVMTIANSSIPAATRVALGLPANIIANHIRTSAYNSSGLITAGPLKGIAFDDGGLTHLFNYGLINGGTVTYMGGDYGSVLNPDEDVRAAYQRGAAMGRVEYEFTPNLNAFFSIGYGVLHTYGDSFGARIPNYNAYPVLANNPFLPASVAAAIASSKSTVSIGNGQTAPGFAYSATRDGDLSSIASRNRTETVQTNFGVRGYETWRGQDWKWDIEGGYGKATFAPDIHNTPITADFFEAAYVVPGPNGQPVCGPIATNPYFNTQPAVVKAALVAQVTPGCVPYNIFGNNKSYNQAALAWFNNASQTDFEFRQYTAQADISGSPVNLPAGPLSIAAGVDWRKETLSSVNCPECQLGALMNQNYSLFSGSVNVTEGYFETDAPLLASLPLIKRLDMNGAVRETNYSSSGAVTTWKVGGTWDVTDYFRLRITRSHDIRAPNINELDNPGSEGNPQVINPANNAQGYIKNNTVGNPNLVPEVGDTITAGMVFQPSWGWSNGFRASVDYWSINLQKIISTLPVQNVINNCYAGATSFCQYITFDSSALGISRVNTPQLNLNAQKTSGLDIELTYRFPLDRLHIPGSLTTRALGMYTYANRTIASGVESNTVDSATVPRFFFSDLTTYQLGQFTGNLTIRYTSPIKYSTLLVGPDDPAYNIASTSSINQNLWYVPLYYNVALSYDIVRSGGKQFQVYLNIDNLFDQNPPVVAWSLSGGPYDLIGRAFKLGFRLKY